MIVSVVSYGFIRVSFLVHLGTVCSQNICSKTRYILFKCSNDVVFGYGSHTNPMWYLLCRAHTPLQYGHCAQRLDGFFLQECDCCKGWCCKLILHLFWFMGGHNWLTEDELWDSQGITKCLDAKSTPYSVVGSTFFLYLLDKPNDWFLEGYLLWLLCIVGPLKFALKTCTSCCGSMLMLLGKASISQRKGQC
jgi:hypothetical protein